MKYFVFSAAVVALATSGASAQQAVQWRVEDGGNGHWYLLVTNPAGAAHWRFDEAHSWANLRGGHLATFSNLAENWFVYNALQVGSANAAVWIGLVQAPGSVEPAGGWSWVTGEPLTFAFWHPGEPTNAGCNLPDNPQHWGILESKTTGSWDDRGDPTPTCGFGTRLAAIEWSADCNGDGIVDYGQILSGQLVDANNNGIPDSCEVNPCPGDITRNGIIDGVDLAAVLGAWSTDGQNQYDCDVDDDGIVAGPDLAYVLSGWGPCP